ncbi:uroporphyrinogen decarboxylase [Ferrimicrobium sp.]|uniref:uroporphyrinogen decarboxylase n=1 Tax=Ferrimicrobium sp. TaxID=2926050 RepID=UPI0026385227|nr:uroporphyrinogen decarboxylase [Ferrimicrobium sp.]
MNTQTTDLRSSLLVKALHQETTERTPIWFMRQAGRSLPEYREVRGVESILKVLQSPELAAEITLQPVRRYQVDAAILYSDIMAPLANLGIGIDIVAGVGPVVEQPMRSMDDVQRLRPVDPSTDLAAMASAVALCVKELTVPLIGFCGGPFTIASYLVEGRPSRTHAIIKALMLQNPEVFHELSSRLVDIAIATLTLQVANGASVVQIFDSWIGTLSPWMFRTLVRPHLQRLADAANRLGVPVIYFGVETAGLLDDLSNLGFPALGLDWRIDLAHAVTQLGSRVALQGNLDPSILLAPTEAVLTATENVLTASANAKGYVFNLGHGVLPETNPDTLSAVVELVHQRGAQLRSETARVQGEVSQ